MTDAVTEPTAAPSAVPPPADLAELGARLDEDVARLDSELGEVDLLVTQAKSEAARHETRRTAAADKLAALSRDGAPTDALEASTQLVNLTRRAALMESQVDVLEGKRRALARHRETIAAYAQIVAAMDPATSIAAAPGPGAAKPAAKRPAGDTAGTPPAVSKAVLSGQEDLRREIARAMHDGPAQSLTNIVLQAQIVERLVTKDPALAQGEVRQLVAMVQQTLEATKTFIFDVRPMVLDDLGLVPTLRRAARERGQRAGISIEFESLGQDRRLSMDLESGLFRILDEALVAYLERSPDQLSLRIDWTPEHVEAHVIAARHAKASGAAEPAPVAAPAEGKDLPPALAAMMEDRRADARDAAEAARKEAIVALPPTAWREIQSRAAMIGATVELQAEGAELHLVVEAPADAEG
jgi:two-component system, NarL family, sensor histidine kinase DegS